nr:hypothetical protein [Candidatus Mycoplasma haematolamae]
MSLGSLGLVGGVTTAGAVFWPQIKEFWGNTVGWERKVTYTVKSKKPESQQQKLECPAKGDKNSSLKLEKIESGSDNAKAKLVCSEESIQSNLTQEIDGKNLTCTQESKDSQKQTFICSYEDKNLTLTSKEQTIEISWVA